MAEQEEDVDVASEEKAGSKKKLLIIVGGAVLLLIITFAGLYFSGFLTRRKIQKRLSCLNLKTRSLQNKRERLFIMQ